MTRAHSPAHVGRGWRRRTSREKQGRAAAGAVPCAAIYRPHALQLLQFTGHKQVGYG